MRLVAVIFPFLGVVTEAFEVTEEDVLWAKKMRSRNVLSWVDLISLLFWCFLMLFAFLLCSLAPLRFQGSWLPIPSSEVVRRGGGLWFVFFFGSSSTWVFGADSIRWPLICRLAQAVHMSSAHHSSMSQSIRQSASNFETYIFIFIIFPVSFAIYVFSSLSL